MDLERNQRHRSSERKTERQRQMQLGAEKGN